MTTAVLERGLADAAPAAQKRRLPVLPVAALLQAQKTLTAVERFAQHHEEGGGPSQEKY
jgi:hypothetical protein